MKKSSKFQSYFRKSLQIGPEVSRQSCAYDKVRSNFSFYSDFFLIFLFSVFQFLNRILTPVHIYPSINTTKSLELLFQSPSLLTKENWHNSNFNGCSNQGCGLKDHRRAFPSKTVGRTLTPGFANSLPSPQSDQNRAWSPA